MLVSQPTELEGNLAQWTQVARRIAAVSSPALLAALL